PPRTGANGARDHVRKLRPCRARARFAADPHPRRAGEGGAVVRGAEPAPAARCVVIGARTRIERSGLDLVIERAQGWFERQQYPEGYWWAELESNATMDAEYLLLTHFLGARNEELWRGLLGQWSWDELSSMPPELMLLPPSAPLSIYRFSSWARGTIVPLLLLMDDRPVHPVPESARLDELRVPDAAPRGPRDAIDRLFRGIDGALRAYDRLPFHPFRERARKAAEQWIL